SWHDALVQGLGANKESGDTMVQLPRGEVLSLSIRPPQDEAAGKGRRRAGPRDILTAGRVAWNRLRERAETVPPRRISDRLNAISPPRLPDRPPARLTATALSVYQHCPAQYRWSVVLGIDEPQPAEVGPGLSRREFGTICHRAMELAVSPEEASIVAAADAALHQHGAADRPGAADLRRRIEQAVRGFWAGPVGRRLAAARRVHRELPFVLGLDGTEIRGTMDLLFEDADGQWELVDYKTATPSVAPTADLAAPYELQLGLYAMAAGQWLGRPLARWSIVFLGADVVAEHPVTDADAAHTRSVARNHLAGIAAGRFECVARPECNHCRYGRLCRKGPAG
ncbi:MAG: PD-(D/E)XK nuclease family protein, partial [Planctomycetes bacterium]|nr:PD-(D/E)XK nuclease family protein [Planctomycetota bacterium]